MSAWLDELFDFDVESWRVIRRRERSASETCISEITHRQIEELVLSRYASMPELIREALTHIPPSKGTPTCYPCRVTLKSGESLDTVYIVSEKPYLFNWGIYPEDDPAKNGLGLKISPRSRTARSACRQDSQKRSTAEASLAWVIPSSPWFSPTAVGKRASTVTL
jgi:hypothetical protein